MIYLDCSCVFRSPGVHTGIQRVTRSIACEARQLREDVRWAALADDGVFYELTSVPQPEDLALSYLGNPVCFGPGDIYFVLDSTWEKDILKRLAVFKPYGVTTGVMYYDLIPLTHPHLSGVSQEIFASWVKETAMYSDFFACISQETCKNLKKQFELLYPSRHIDDEVFFDFYLGANLPVSVSVDIPRDSLLLNAFSSDKTYLIVSTIEPRKNHSFALDAFDLLWERFPDIKLCFIGKKGWMIDNFIDRIDRHPLKNISLYWLDSLSDLELQWAYKQSKCVLYPSVVEGFGLPIVEALHHKVPVLAGDIPVFREIAGDRIGYFDLNSPASLVRWIEQIENTGVPRRLIPDSEFSWPSWKESAEDLLGKILRVDQVARNNLAPVLQRYNLMCHAGMEMWRQEEIREGLPSESMIFLTREEVEVFAPESDEKIESNVLLEPFTDEISCGVLSETDGGEKNMDFSESINMAPFPLQLPRLPIRHLLRMEGHELIRHAYVRFLHRMPDPEGESFYFGKLMQGYPPVSLIAALRFSEEGQKIAEPVKHPAILNALGRLMGSPRFWGKIARYCASLRFLSGTRGMARVAIMQLQEHINLLAEQKKTQSDMAALWRQEIEELKTRLNTKMETDAADLAALNDHVNCRFEELIQSVRKQADKSNALELSLTKEIKRNNDFGYRLEVQAERNRKLEQRLAEQAELDKSLEQRFVEQVEFNRELEQRLAEQAELAKSLEQRFAEQAELDKGLEQKFIEQTERYRDLEQRFVEQSEFTKGLEQKFAEQAERNNEFEQAFRKQMEHGELMRQERQNMEEVLTDLIAEESRERAAALTPPGLPFAKLVAAEPFLERAEYRVGKEAPLLPEERKTKFYTYFSEIWGEGYEDNQNKHYEAYLPYITQKTPYPFLDIGCGAGEFLAFLQGHGIKTLGIDYNEEEVKRTLERGLRVYCADALTFLREYKGYFSGISMLQVIEHIPQEDHLELLSLAKQRLADEGLLIVETINPAHPLAMNGFFTDPTHLRPVPSDYTVFLTQWCGFKKVNLLHLYPVPLDRYFSDNIMLYYYNYAVLAYAEK